MTSSNNASTPNIPAAAVATARDLFNQGNYGQAWDALAQASFNKVIQ